MKPFRAKALLAILFPLLVMAGWLGKLYFSRESGIRIELPIRAYDPRDILSGHYLTFEVVYGDTNVCSPDGQRHIYDTRSSFCHCVREGEKPVYWSGLCDNKPAECDHFIEGRCTYSGFKAGVERFYISERLSHERFIPSKEAKVKLSVPRNGRALVVGITP